MSDEEEAPPQTEESPQTETSPQNEEPPQTEGPPPTEEPTQNEKPPQTEEPSQDNEPAQTEEPKPTEPEGTEAQQERKSVGQDKKEEVEQAAETETRSKEVSIDVIKSASESKQNTEIASKDFAGVSVTIEEKKEVTVDEQVTDIPESDKFKPETEAADATPSRSFEDKKDLTKSTESLDKQEAASEEKEDRRKSRSDRISKAKNVLGSIISIRRTSVGGDIYDRSKGARFMNSYKLDSDNPFKPEKVQKILEGVMVEAFENLTYDPEKCPKQAKWASSAIRAKVKELQFDRYKLICLVTIGEKNAQDVLVTCRFLWDVDRDRYATYCIENTHVFGIAQCFGVYYE